MSMNRVKKLSVVSQDQQSLHRRRDFIFKSRQIGAEKGMGVGTSGSNQHRDNLQHVVDGRLHGTMDGDF